MALDSFGQGGKMLLILLMYGSCQKLVTKLCTYSVYVELKKKGLYSSQVAHHAGAFPGFCSMKWLEVSPLPPSSLDGMLVHLQGYPPLSTLPGFPDKLLIPTMTRPAMESNPDLSTWSPAH